MPNTTTATAPRSAAQPINIKPLGVRPAVARIMLGVGKTKLYEILPELESYLDGNTRIITLASIEAYHARRLAAATAARKPVPSRENNKRKHQQLKSAG